MASAPSKKRPYNSNMKDINFNIFQGFKPKVKLAKGSILIAEPFLQGRYFSRSIIFLTDYSKDGAVGFVLNKSSDLYPDEVIEDLFSFKGELFLGGPVSSDTLHFLHTFGSKVPGSIQVTQNIYWGGDFQRIKDLVNVGKADESSVKFFAGYSGWAPGQLEAEIAENSWIVSKLDDKEVMDNQIDNLWSDSLHRLGDDIYKTWNNFPTNPAFN
jgi:putative transcriptional regulator